MVDRRTMMIGGAAVVLAGASSTYLGIRDVGSLEDYNACVTAMRAALKQTPQARDLIRYATLAANSHNTQPWRFTLDERAITILPDVARRLAAVDPDNHHLFVSLGCAAENLAIAAGMRGKPGTLNFDPRNGGAVRFEYGAGSPEEPALFQAIPQRQSTRNDYDGIAVNKSALKAIVRAATIPGVDLFLITDGQQIGRVRDLVVEGNSTQMADAAFLRELKSWLRYNPRRALATGDGLFTAASGNPSLPDWLGPLVFDKFVTKGSENDKYARQLRSSAGVAVFVGAQDTPEHWTLAGRACQRFALQATALGLKCAFINQPVEVAALRPELAALAGMPGRRPDIVMRFGYGPSMPISARRLIDAVIQS